MDDVHFSLSSGLLHDLLIKALSEVDGLFQWFEDNRLVVNTSKTQIVEFKIRKSHPEDNFTMNIKGTDVTTSSVTKFLGVSIDKNLNFSQHKDAVCKKISAGIFVLRQLSNFLGSEVLLTVYYGLIYPFLSYAVAIWGHECSSSKSVFRLQKKAIRAVFRKRSRDSCRPLFLDNNILTFPSIYIMSCLIFVRKNFSIFETAPPVHRYNLRPQNNLQLPAHRTSFFERQLRYNGARLYNALPDNIKAEPDVKRFGRRVKDYLLEHCFYSVANFLST